MRIAKLIDIDQDILLSSTVAASGEVEYDSGTTYNTGDKVKVSYESDGTTPLAPVAEYESLADSNTGNYPPDNPDKWQETSSSNRWKMFDQYVNTQTEDTEEIEVELDSSKQNIVGLFRLQAKEVTLAQIVNSEMLTDGDCSTDSFTAETGWSYDSGNQEYDCDGSQTGESRLYQSVTLKTAIHYQIVFTVANYSAGTIAGIAGGQSGTSVSADGTYTQIIAPGDTDQYVGVVADADFVGSITSVSVKKVPNYETVGLDYYDLGVSSGWYYYFFSDLDYLQDMVWSFIDYTDSTLRITITWKPGETAKCGMVALGKQNELGMTEYGVDMHIIDYSVKKTDSLGRTYKSSGNFAKGADISFWLYNSRIDAVRRVLQTTVEDDTPLIIDANNAGTTGTDYTSLLIYGFFRDFHVSIPGPTISRCNMEIEGLI